jgi:uncharacterized protein YprB with RNaseH-like and TPR domain
VATVNLKDRLALIKSAKDNKDKNAFSPPRRRDMPQGWIETAPSVWTREVDRPCIGAPKVFFPHLMRPAPMPEDGREGRGGAVAQSVDLPPIPAGRIVFFDLETTGLSGGAGTIAFLSTVGHFEGADLVLRQTFLGDYPGERDFLASVISHLDEADWIVTYNGAAFDIPLLQTRCVLNRIAMPPVRHIDVLHDCRRFWGRKVASCSLASMEALVLKKERDEDIPAALVPKVWLDYVKTEVPRDDQGELLSLVWQHNVQDVVSLARLFVLIESANRAPDSAVVQYAIDPAGLARRLMKAGRLEEAKRILLMVRDRAELFELTESSKMRALRHLASIAWKERNRNLYVNTILAMDGRSLFGCVAKAKLYEHFLKDEEEALRWAKRARDIALAEGMEEDGAQSDMRGSALTIEAIDHRIARLARKIAKMNSLSAR